jgi:hypothetical protein
LTGISRRGSQFGRANSAAKLQALWSFAEQDTRVLVTDKSWAAQFRVSHVQTVVMPVVLSST